MKLKQLCSLVTSLWCVNAYSPSLAAVYVVTNNSGNPGVVNSLPWAVTQANYFSRGLDFIKFNIPISASKIINISQTLYINDQVVIDGTSQPGYSGSPLIYVQGSSLTPSIFLLQNDPSQGVNSSGSTIQGLGIYGFSANAITIFRSSTGNYIQNNWIGFMPNLPGLPLLNTRIPTFEFTRGIGLQSSFNVIRGNTISGVDNAITLGEPIEVQTPSAQYKTNSIRDNKIGTDPSGATSSGYGNTSDGIFLGSGARENFIGPNNILSGNQSSGVEFLHPTNQGNVVFLNNIGTDITGRNAIPNGELGILLSNRANGNAIGGPFGGNIISGNILGGISIGTSTFGPANYNYLQYNIIGLNNNQSSPIVISGGRLQGVGVSIQSGSVGNLLINNVLSGHSSHGVVVQNAQSNGINQNWIGRSAFGNASGLENGGFGIALLTGASFNFVQGNAFGNNRLGNIYLDPAAIGNAF